MKKVDAEERMMSDAIDLVCDKIGGYAMATNDDFFASRENLTKDAEAVFDADAFQSSGKIMDGWESRRRREEGFDWCILRLGVPGLLQEIVIDTSFFRGNFPPYGSVEGCFAPHNATPKELSEWEWFSLVDRVPLEGHKKSRFSVDSSLAVTHLRLNMYPDGGIARLRAYGRPLASWMRPAPIRRPLDLALAKNGGFVESCSDMFFSDRQNLIAEPPSLRMDHGWETKRRRDKGHDWAILRLACPGKIDSVELDTSWFKGNAPGQASLEATCDENWENAQWQELLPAQNTNIHARHTFEEELVEIEKVRYVRLNIFPDGGMARVRLYGKPDCSALKELRLRWLNSVPKEIFKKELKNCCSSEKWLESMATSRPFSGEKEWEEAAHKAFGELSSEDWSQAFSSHPKIGEKSSVSQSKRGNRWSSQEQSRLEGSEGKDLERLAELNQAYETKFGHVFLICATGKSLDEMLEAIETRIEHSKERELEIAGQEQEKITLIRMEKMLCQ